MPLIGGAVVPHAPLLLEAISGPAVSGKVATCREGIASLSFEANTLILISPHGETRGVYAGRRGDLDDFGRAGVSVETSSADDLARELSHEWDAPTIGAPFDHGIVTPLAAGLLPGTQVVAVVSKDVADGRALGEAIKRVAGHRPTRLAVIASAHLGARLTGRAPLAFDPRAVELEDDVIKRLPKDAAVLADRAEDLDKIGGSCSAGPLASFGTLFTGRPVDIVAYQRPFGVGYLVARVDG